MTPQLIPKKFFLTHGSGTHARQLVSFELALRDAGVEPFNFVLLSSIIPPHCELVDKDAGTAEIMPTPGMIVPCVMSMHQTEVPRQLISASIGVAFPQDRNHYGYISEYHASGMTNAETAEVVEDMAATMLGSSMGIDADPDEPWSVRRPIITGDPRFGELMSVSEARQGFWDGTGIRKWTTVLSLAVFIL